MTMAPGWLKRRLTPAERDLFVAWSKWDQMSGDEHYARCRQDAIEALATERGLYWRPLWMYLLHVAGEHRPGASEPLLRAIVDPGGF